MDGPARLCDAPSPVCGQGHSCSGSRTLSGARPRPARPLGALPAPAASLPASCPQGTLWTGPDSRGPAPPLQSRLSVESVGDSPSATEGVNGLLRARGWALRPRSAGSFPSCRHAAHSLVLAKSLPLPAATPPSPPPGAHAPSGLPASPARPPRRASRQPARPTRHP